jgi:hypothetical protein
MPAVSSSIAGLVAVFAGIWIAATEVKSRKRHPGKLTAKTRCNGSVDQGRR